MDGHGAYAAVWFTGQRLDGKARGGERSRASAGGGGASPGDLFSGTRTATADRTRPEERLVLRSRAAYAGVKPEPRGRGKRPSAPEVRPLRSGLGRGIRTGF